MSRKAIKLLSMAIVILWAIIWSRLISFRDSGIYFHQDLMWADWAAHTTMVSRMAYGTKLIPTQSPLMVGYPFSYPFGVNLISALLVKLGLPLFTAMILVSFFASIMGTIVLFVFLQKLFQSTLITLIASCLFYLNGGLGFFLSSTQKMTHDPNISLHLINIIESMFIPQRAFTLGFPLTLMILIFVFHGLRQPQKKFFKRYFGCGLLIGLMPIIHTHSFLTLFFILSSWVIGSWFLTPSSKKKNLLFFWLAIFIGTSLTAIPIIRFYFFHNLQPGFLQWHPGWYALEDQINWLWFWFLNWGMVPILGLLGYILLLKQTLIHQTNQALRWRLLFLSPFWLIFILINLFQFQPNIWDNTKLWVYSSVGVSSLAAYFLVKTWHRLQNNSPINLSLKVILVLILILSVMAGSHDVYQITQVQKKDYLMYSAEELSLAQWVKVNTPRDSIWLTSDKHNLWLSNLTGRQSLMGYRGWLWTQGYQYQTLEQEMQQMFQQPQHSGHLFEKHQVDYVVIGPDAKTKWGANQAQFDQLQLIKASANYQIYAL